MAPIVCDEAGLFGAEIEAYAADDAVLLVVEAVVDELTEHLTARGVTFHTGSAVESSPGTS